MITLGLFKFVKSLDRSAAFAVSLCALFCFTHNLSAQDFSASSTDLISRGTFSGATQSNGPSTNARISKNGRFVVFESTAGNLVNFPFTPTPGRRYVYLYDRQADSLEVVSMTYSERSPDADSFAGAVSNDGRYVAFITNATLERNNINSMVTVCCNSACHIQRAYPGYHVYVRDRLANDTFLISQVSMPVKVQQIDSATGLPQVAITPGPPEVRIPVLETKTLRVAASGVVARGVVPPTPDSRNPRLSGDGRFVVYDTTADNLYVASDPPPVYPAPLAGVDYDDTVGIIDPDICLIEPSGFYADGNDVRDVYVRDGQNFTNSLVSLGCQYHAPDGCNVIGDLDSSDGGISDDGTIVVFSTKTAFLDLDFNAVEDVFLIERSSINGEVSNLVRISNNTSRLVAGNGASTKPAISADGRYVVFQSAASNLVTGDTNGKTDIFLFDRPFNKMVRCSALSDGTQGNGDSLLPDITGSGEYISFHSSSTNFGFSTSPGVNNVYVGQVTKSDDGDATGCTIELASAGTGTGASSDATISGVAVVPETVSGGRIRRSAVSYQSVATNVTTESDTNGLSDIFQSPICSEADRTTDTDFDGTTDCFDQCHQDATKVTDVDSDFDGFADCEDGCKNDPQKSLPGACGCGVADTDTDQDGTRDCNDQCPNDPAKTAPGQCGCGQVDVDLDQNGVIDCKQSGSVTPAPAATPTPACGLSSVTPNAPTLKRKSGGRALVRIPSFAVPGGVVLLRFAADICLESDPTTCPVSGQAIGGNRKRTFKNIPTGTYVARYIAVGNCGNSLVSANSNSARIVKKKSAKRGR